MDLNKTLEEFGEFAAVDVLYDKLDELLINQDFEGCDTVLRDTPFNTLPASLALSALTITRPYAHRLKHREDLVLKTIKRLREERGDAVAQQLLQGLR